MTGEELYDCIYDALEDGKIGTVTIPWRDVPSAERQVWSRIAGDARAEALSRIRHPSALPLADDDSEAQAEASERIARFTVPPGLPAGPDIGPEILNDYLAAHEPSLGCCREHFNAAAELRHHRPAPSDRPDDYLLPGDPE